MNEPVVVTGAAGFAGSHLLDLLAGNRMDVVAWHRPGGAPPREVRGVRWRPVDLLDRPGVQQALEADAPAIVYHCAGAAHVGRSWDHIEATFAVNVRGTHHVVESLRDLGIDARVLIPSSAMVYGASGGALTENDPLVPSSPYAVSKLAQEMVGRGNGDHPPVLIARAFNHFGPRQDPWFVASGFARRIADIEAGRWKPVLSVGNLDARRDLTDVRDTVRAYRLIAEQGAPGRVYNVCSGRAIAIRDLLDMMMSRARVPITVEADPSRYRPNDVPIVLGDAARLRTELGWTPAISLEQTVDDLLAYWRSRGPA
jgi:GDP-4-dehydro-6-deoxy-D-mannose reductase